MVAMISGIIESNRVNLPQICLKEKSKVDLESRIHRTAEAAKRAMAR